MRENTLKPVIIHFIYNLGRGGAESLLVNSVAQLEDYDNVLVTLEKTCDFSQNLPFIECINLDSPSSLKIPIAIKRFRSAIKKYHPVLIHSHLPLPNIIARFATPKHIPLISTIHTTISQSIAYRKLHIRQLEKYSLGKRQSLILGVSKNVLSDYETFLSIKNLHGKVLYNFAECSKYNSLSNPQTESEVLRMVSVGTIKFNKNYEFLLNALLDLSNSQLELDIYGRGTPPLLMEKIKKKGLPVNFKGEAENIKSVLCRYDVFVSASKFEGFSISVLEAMASGIAILLSDIPSHREQCGDSAIYFSLKDSKDLKSKINYCLIHKKEIKIKAELGYKRFRELFTLEAYINNLRKIYTDEISQYEYQIN